MFAKALQSRLFWIIFVGCSLIAIALYYLVTQAQQIDDKNVSDALFRAHSTITGAVIKTTYGEIEIVFDKGKAPQTVENFIVLNEKDFYEGTYFHRIVPDTLIQGGDPFSRGAAIHKYGTGGPGYSIVDEFNDSDMTAGAVVMYNTGKGTAGSQFFILVDRELPNLQGKYTVFGRVTRGLDIAREISNQQANENGLPNEMVKIDFITLK